MKRKAILFFGVILLLLLANFIAFVITFGAYSNNPPSLNQKLSAAFSNPSIWINPFFTFFIAISNPISILFFAVVIIILYYIYDNFIKVKPYNIVEASTVQVKTEKDINTTIKNKPLVGRIITVETNENTFFKKLVLFATIAIAIFVTTILSIPSDPGSGMVGFMFLLPLLPIIYFFYPVYFMVLSIKYLREKSNMHVLDKIMFYILLTGVLLIIFFLLVKLF